MSLRFRILPAILSSLLVCAVVAAPADARKRARSAHHCANASVSSGQVSERTLAHSTVCLLNVERTSRGLRALRVNRRRSRAARQHSRDMVRKRYFAHTSRSGSNMSDRIRRYGYLRHARRWMIGENLAWGSGWRSSPRAIVQAWMHSPGHRHNILTGRFREIGIGVIDHAPVSTASRGATFTTTFGSRR